MSQVSLNHLQSDRALQDYADRGSSFGQRALETGFDVLLGAAGLTLRASGFGGVVDALGGGSYGSYGRGLGGALGGDFDIPGGDLSPGDMLRLQYRLQKLQMITNTVSNSMKAEHEARMAAVRNMKP